MQKGIIVTHTHWDREWRYPLWENRQYLMDMMDELLMILDTQPDYAGFLMDGQTVMVEDYLAMRPENTQKVKEYIRAGRIDVGPWYTLPDLYPVCGESLVRNLLEGKRSAEKLGRRLNVAHESFGWGQTAQFPQLYHQFGLDFVVVAKNISGKRCPTCEFVWEAPDGTRVLATRLGEHARANFFMNAYLYVTTGKDYNSDEYFMHLGQDGQVYHEADSRGCWEDYFLLSGKRRLHEDRIAPGVERAWHAMDQTVLPQHRLLMNGSDSSTAQPELMTLLQKARKALPEYELETGMLDSYAQTALQKIDPSQLPHIRGELRDGPAFKCSANALATRPGIKLLNKKAESTLFLLAEPLCAMADVDQHAFLNEAIRFLLLSHPHDSINGVTQDKTARDTLFRLEQALEIGEVVANNACRAIVRQLDYSAYAPEEALLTVFNTLPYPRSTVVHAWVDFPQEWESWDVEAFVGEEPVRCEVLSRREKVTPVSELHVRPLPYALDRFELLIDLPQLPAAGYLTLHLRPVSRLNRKTEFWPDMRKSRGDEIAASVQELENEFLLVHVADNGTVDITDKQTGRVYRNLNALEDTGDHGDYWIYYPPYHNQTYSSSGLRAELWQEENTALRATTVARVVMRLPEKGMLNEHSKHGESSRSETMKDMPVTFRYTLEKGARGLKVRAEVENTVQDHRLRLTFDTGLHAENACAAGHFYLDRRLVRPRNAAKAFYPEMQTLPKQTFVSLREGQEGFAFVDDCTCEYEAAADGRLSVTLLRGVRNRICTEFRSAGEFPHEDGGQSLGRLTYDYMLLPFSGEEAALCREAECFRVAPKVIQTCRGDGTLPDHASLLELPAPLVMTALKPAQSGQGRVLRCFNPGERDVSIPRTGWFAGAKLMRMDETLLAEPNAPIVVKPNQIITMEVAHEHA